MPSGVYKRTEEHRRKIRLLSKGRPPWNKGKTGVYSKDALARMSQSHKGKKLSKEHIANVSKALKGRHHTEETKRKISKALKGRKFSKAQIERMREVGKKLWQNPDFRKRVIESNKGRMPWNTGMKMSKEHKKKLSESHKGFEIPMETRIKLSIAMKKHFAENKDSKDYLSGENSIFWQNGISREPYPFEFDARLKERIKKRDGYQCQNPDCEGKPARLCVHHVNYCKQDFRDENLITLCNYCNVKANFKRETWQEVYSEIIKEVSL